MRQLIAGNWKMNGLLADSLALAAAVAAGAAGLGCDVLVCPPATVLRAVAGKLHGSVVAVGGQDCHAAPGGAHTGDLAAAMLRDAGASAVILGHSERRSDHGESNAVVRAKVMAAAAEGLLPIVCVGETEAERLAGRQETVVREQLVHSLPDAFAGAVAYEPVWAIGTGRMPTEADIAAMHATIRRVLMERLGANGRGVRILYGGSVKPANAQALLALPEVGGALVGGASLVAADFLAIASAAAA
jgi:triosephosphate isomerase